MKKICEMLKYWLSTLLFGLLAILFLMVLITSFSKNLVVMYDSAGWNWTKEGNYVGLFLGFIAYGLFLCSMIIPRVRHNLNWFMKFTHELTHTLVAMLFFAKIREFVVRDRECYVNYMAGPVGYVPITLALYCIPIYTFMLFPFRFAGDSHYMIIFDFLIAFTYAFHIHAFIKQTRSTQPDIEGCGLARSTTFITFIHMCVLSLIFAIPKGGVMKAIHRVFWEYPIDIITDPSGWFHDVIRYF
jgi:hypothetical protein